MSRTLPIERMIQDDAVAAARVDWGALGLGVAVFAALSLWFGLRSEGFLEEDARTHFVIARWAFEQPENFANMWGRPWCTGLYAAPAVLAGRAGVQVTSCVLAIVIAVFTALVGQGLGYRRPELAGIFVLAQPLVFLHSFSEMPELPFAVLVAVGLWGYVGRRWGVMAVCAALMPLSRPEGFGLVMLAGVALVMYRRWRWLAVLPVPLVMWNVAGWVLNGQEGTWWRWLIDSWPWAGKSVYKSGPLWRFVARLPVLVGPLVFPALLVGVGVLGREVMARGRRGLSGASDDWHGLMVRVVVLGMPLGVLAVHSVLHWTGRLASSGELRYLMVATPMWALLVARGWEWAADWTQWRRWVVTAAGMAAVLPLTANLAWGVIPVRSTEDARVAEAVARWYLASEYRQSHPYLMASHAAVYYYADVSMNDETRTRFWGRRTVAQRPEKTLLVWDPVYGLYNADERLSVKVAEIEAAGWKEIPWPLDFEPPRRAWSEEAWLNSPEPGDTWRIFVSE